MTDRDRLEKLYEKAVAEYGKTNKAQFKKSFVCDFLIANGVIVPPCKVGDKIYQTDGIRIYESTVMEVTYTTNKVIYCTESVAFDERAISETVFLTKEQAEEKLNETKTKE